MQTNAWIKDRINLKIVFLVQNEEALDLIFVILLYLNHTIYNVQCIYWYMVPGFHFDEASDYTILFYVG